MPARGRTRISSTGSERNGESAMRASSTTVPLTLRSRLNILFIRRFLAVFWLSAVSCALWGVEGACRIIVCDQAGRCDREALCPILRWVAGRVAFAAVGVAFVDAGVPADGRVRGDLAHAPSRDREGSPGSFVPGVGDSRRDVVSRARCLSRVRWADAPERGGVVQARPSAVRGFLERRDGLPSQGALHALRRERPGAWPRWRSSVWSRTCWPTG